MPGVPDLNGCLGGDVGTYWSMTTAHLGRFLVWSVVKGLGEVIDKEVGGVGLH